MRPNLLENDNTVEQPQSSTQEPLPLVPAPQPTVVSDSECDDGDEETDPLGNPTSERKSRATTKSNAKELMKIAHARSKPWKCDVCFRFFSTNTAFRQNFVDNHIGRKICKPCPYSCDRQSDLIKHQESHVIKDVKFKNNPRGQECKLCNVWFGGKRKRSRNSHKKISPAK